MKEQPVEQKEKSKEEVHMVFFIRVQRRKWRVFRSGAGAPHRSRREHKESGLWRKESKYY